MAVSEVCVVFEVLCSISDGHYTEFGNCSIFYEEKGRCANETRVSHLTKGRQALWRCVSPLLNMKKEYLQIILHGILPVPTRIMTIGTHTCTYVYQRPRVGLVLEAPRGA
jgi:hypothetical protein